MAGKAISHPLPSYPEESLGRGAAGVAVTRVRTDAVGRVRSVEVLQAPDGAIATAVADTLTVWSFEPLTSVWTSGDVSGVPRGVEGKIVMYFRIIDKKGVISFS